MVYLNCPESWEAGDPGIQDTHEIFSKFDVRMSNQAYLKKSNWIQKQPVRPGRGIHNEAPLPP